MLKFSKNANSAIPFMGLVAISFVLLFSQNGCKNEVEKEIGLDEKYGLSSTEYKYSIKQTLLNDDLKLILEDSLFQYYDLFKRFYVDRKFEPVFVNGFENENLIFSLLVILNKAGEHGISPSAYYTELIEKEFSSAIVDSLDSSERHNHLSKAELLASFAILKYCKQLRFGIVNPKALYPDSYYLPVKEISESDLFEPFNQINIIHYLQDIQPKTERYKKLQAALQNFKSYKSNNWQAIPILNKKLEIGDRDSLIVQIAAKLIFLGYLDTSVVKIDNFSAYDSLLSISIKEFQTVNGLNDDGVIGKNTIDKLNTPPEEYINKIIINLERFRWLNYPDSSSYILVNIPEFKLHVFENEEEIFDIKVCTGRKRPSNYSERLKVYKRTRHRENKPDDWETPNMYGEISYLVLNPTWSVPNSIIREEIVNKITKDSTYLKSRNFKVYQDGVEINVDDVITSKLSSDTIPYRIVQDSGPGNALGKIKFMFKNPFGIYLHDTPTRSPFGYSNRAVSHGCVRVEKPLQLAEFVLKDHSKWNLDYLKIETGQKVESKEVVSEYYQKRSSLRRNHYSSKDKTTEVILERKIPLFIDYYTAWVDINGEINFRDDVYRRDKILYDYIIPGNQI